MEIIKVPYSNSWAKLDCLPKPWNPFNQQQQQKKRTGYGEMLTECQTFSCYDWNLLFNSEHKIIKDMQGIQTLSDSNVWLKKIIDSDHHTVSALS